MRIRSRKRNPRAVAPDHDPQAASGRWVRAVPGGVVRSARSPEPTVAVVIGGGAGHYPAFAGLVRPSLAHGAAMGNLFASPSTKRAYSVAKAADLGRACCSATATTPVTS